MIHLEHYISEILLTGLLINQSDDLFAQNQSFSGKLPEIKQEKSDGSKRNPNFIVILTDDQGYQDVGIYGSPDIKTPRLDRMAEEGIRFTNFYAQTVCGPSRASLMTGCYPMRIGTKHNTVEQHPRLHTGEITIAEVLKNVGYVNGVFGKWDLAGHSQTEYEKELLPHKQGFDYFFGTPTSNDAFVNLLRNDQEIEQNADLSTLTERYTDEVIKFIGDQKGKPFFVYLAHSMPHMKLAASDQFQGKSERGLYGDVIEEIDYNLGRILDTLKKLELNETTFVFFLSDNGPWHVWGEFGGDAAPLRGAKTSAWEGGFRVPFIVWAPDRIPQNVVCNEIASSLDIFPTIAKLANAHLPSDRKIDGHDISSLLGNKQSAKGPTKVFYYYQRTLLRAVRSGDWKLHLPRPKDPVWGHYLAKEDNIDIEQPMLFNLDTDISEQEDLAIQNPKIVARLLRLAAKAQRDLGDYDRIGKGQRFYDPDPRRPDLVESNTNN